MLTRASVVFACCVLSVPCAVVEGQTGVGLHAGQTVRVRLADGQRFEARLVGVDSSPLVLRFAQSPQGVPISSIDSLWLRRRGTARGAIIGGIVVGGASFALAAVVCTALGEGTGCDAWGTVVAFSVAGASVGALLGAGMGSLFPRWQRVDPQRVTISLGVGNLGLRAGARIRF